MAEDTAVKDIDYTITDPENFNNTVREFKGKLRTLSEARLTELYDRVIEAEEVLEGKLSQPELNVIQLLGGLLAVVETHKLNLGVGQTKESKEYTYKQSILMQQNAIKAVLSNLDKRGRPIKALSDYFGLIHHVFFSHFDKHSGSLENPIHERRGGFLQGIHGMIAASLLFNECGFEIRLPPTSYDMRYEIDLILRDVHGKEYAVDITERHPRDEEPAFMVKRISPPKNAPHAIRYGYTFFHVNLPPITHGEAEKFYEDKSTGYPSSYAVEKFADIFNSARIGVQI